MKKILVPTDFSEQADAAVEVASQLGKKTNANVTLLHVVEVPHGVSYGSFSATGQVAASSDPSDNVFVMEMLKRAKEKMEGLVNEDRFEGVDLHYHIGVGNPFGQIKDMTHEQEIDLVVIGTKGSTGLSEVLIGSNTEKVVRLSEAPVLSVKKAVDISSIKKVVFASSLHQEDANLAKHLKALVEVLGAELHLLRVNTPNNFQSDKTTFKNMEVFKEQFGLTSAKDESYSDAIEEDGIIHYAEMIDADLIAMATHGRTGFMHLLSGSIAEDVVNHAKRPVWTFNVK